MIRWDPAGEHIIVERPEQLALHVLPSIYRQSRFASFSRQLNVCPPPMSARPCPDLPQIYGFMRKVNLRNVDPAIDDPDASTWCKSRAKPQRQTLIVPFQRIRPSTATRPPRSSQTSSAESPRVCPSRASAMPRRRRPSRLHAPPSAWVACPFPGHRAWVPSRTSSQGRLSAVRAASPPPDPSTLSARVAPGAQTTSDRPCPLSPCPATPPTSPTTPACIPVPHIPSSPFPRQTIPPAPPSPPWATATAAIAISWAPNIPTLSKTAGAPSTGAPPPPRTQPTTVLSTRSLTRAVAGTTPRPTTRGPPSTRPTGRPFPRCPSQAVTAVEANTAAQASPPTAAPQLDTPCLP